MILVTGIVAMTTVEMITVVVVVTVAEAAFLLGLLIGHQLISITTKSVSLLTARHTTTGRTDREGIQGGSEAKEELE